MIGLGDIIIPGIYLSFMLRFDISKNNKKNIYLSHCKYFLSTYLGYFLGILFTLIANVLFKTHQPALLYIIPFIILFSFIPCAIDCDVSSLLNYNEENNLK